jgi:hypothetical protein
MPFTINATPDAAEGLFTRLTASGGLAPYRWTATPNGLSSYPVPATTSDPTGASTLDGRAPFGIEVTYQCTDATGASLFDSATLPDPPGPVLSDALDPNRSAFVTIVDQLPNEWAARSVWFDVLDRRDPFVALAPMRLRNGVIVLRTDAGNDNRRVLFDLLTPGGPLVLRAPCHDAVDDLTLLVTDVSEDLTIPDAKTGSRLWRLTYQAVSNELGPYLPDPEWTWDELVADPRNPSWTTVKASFSTWDDLAGNIRKP